MYEALGCSYVEVVTCDLGDIWIDEVGLFVQNNPILSLHKNLPNIAGAMMFSKGSKEGETIWFDKSDKSDLLTMDSITQLIINSKYIGFTRE